MGSENSSDNPLAINREGGIIEITPLKINKCDAIESISVDFLINLFISENVPDASIDTSKITILELSQCNITELPEACKKLNLKHLGLSRNNLENVPLCLYIGLKHLESLDLSYNKIQNFDMEPECLPFIRIILLNNNAFKNVPKWFLMFRCTNLEALNYSNNKSTHYRYLKNSFNLNFVKLKKLELKNNCLNDSDYNFLKCFKSLRCLDISNDDTSDEGDRFLNQFQELDELFVKPKWEELNILKLQGLSLSLFPEGIAWIETLRELYLSKNNLSWLPDDIQFLVNLEILSISHNCIIAISSNVGSLQKLAILDASYNAIESLPDFSLMGNLKTLDLYNNMLDTITFSMDTIDFVDLEDNYCDTKSIANYSAYEKKKNYLRNKYSYQRYDGPRLSNISSSSASSSSDSESYYEIDRRCLQTTSSNVVSFDETENWDLPVKERVRNPEIDSIDEQWQGEDHKCYSNDYSRKGRIYVSDEDWMFVDFEES